MVQTLPLLCALLPLASAHFSMKWPTPRGNDDGHQMTSFPCGGYDKPSAERTEFPLTGAPIQLNMGHTQTNIKVLLALGNDPGSSFNITLRPTFQQEGPRDFCIGELNVPGNAEELDGMNATIQVLSNGDPTGGLYTCADVVLTSKQFSESEYSNNCKNSSAIKINQENIPGNPNETTSEGGHSHGTPTEGGAASPSQTGLAGSNTAVTWALCLVGAAAFAIGL